MFLEVFPQKEAFSGRSELNTIEEQSERTAPEQQEMISKGLSGFRRD